jgi:acetate kinase
MRSQTVQRILTINTGSSSLKVGLYEVGREETRLLSGEVERIGVPGGHVRLTDSHRVTLLDQGGDLPDHGAALEAVLAWLGSHRPDLTCDAVGHRVVHGGATAVRLPPGRPADGLVSGHAGQAPDLHPRAFRGHAGNP